MNKSDKIYIAGHTGLIGGGALRLLTKQGYTNLVTRTREQLNLANQTAVEDFFQTEKPDIVILAAAKVGGIIANKTQPGDFILENLQIQTNVIGSAFKHGTKKFLFLGSSCIYPAEAKQPITEDALMTGPLEPTNDAYAVAKIAGIMLGRSLRRQYGFNFISAQPTNLYGVGDNFHPRHAHVIPGMMARMHKAKTDGDKTFSIWGTGKPLREFLNAEDCATALLTLLEKYDEEGIINVGTGTDITIAELARHMQKTVGFEGELVFDTTKPDGMARKLLDVSRLKALGWQPQVKFEDGLKEMYAWFLANQQNLRAA
jgi:GDP-L-fucose synthase